MPNLFGRFCFDESLDRSDSVFESPSAIEYRNEFGILSDSCLTNRTELFVEFGVLLSEQKTFPDSKLILMSYEKWGEKCVDHLSGDFAFAICDRKTNKLFCARDQFGGSKFFYYKDKERFLFGNSPRSILKHGGVDEKLNKNKLALFLFQEPHTLTANESWFENIVPLPAGFSLTVDSNGLRTGSYWKPEIRTVLPYKNHEDVLEAFRELIFEVVGARLQSNDDVSALLSGGLDSSTIVSVAAQILEQRNKELNVIAGVLESENDPEYKDERFFIDQFKSFRNVNISYVSAPQKGPFSDLERFAESYGSPVSTSRHYLYRSFAAEARKKGCDTLLEGNFGEFGPTTYGKGGFAEMFVSLKWLRLWQELRMRRARYGVSIKYNLRANILNPLLPDFVYYLRRQNQKNQILLNKSHPLTDGFFQELLDKNETPESIYGRSSSDHRVNQLSDLLFLQAKASETPSTTFGEEPVDFRQPFLDKRLFEFCLAAPLELKIRGGYTRYLVRAGLEGILPPEIQWRTTKIPFSPDYIRRYRSQIKQVKQMLDDISPNDSINEILDIEKIKGWVDKSASISESESINNPFIYSYIPQAIYLIYFLRRFSEFKN